VMQQGKKHCPNGNNDGLMSAWSGAMCSQHGERGNLPTRPLSPQQIA
jgi:hypothetical protein